MKHRIITIILTIAFLLGVAGTTTPVFAADPCYNSDGSLATSCFLYAVDPLNPTNSGNDGSLGDGITQMARWIMFQTPGGIMSVLLPYLFTIAGLILFVMILWGGFEMLSGASDTKAQEAGKQRIIAALIGFVLLFISFWIAQIIQYIFGVNVVG